MLACTCRTAGACRGPASALRSLEAAFQPRAVATSPGWRERAWREMQETTKPLTKVCNNEPNRVHVHTCTTRRRPTGVKARRGSLSKHSQGGVGGRTKMYSTREAVPTGRRSGQWAPLCRSRPYIRIRPISIIIVANLESWMIDRLCDVCQRIV